MRVRDCMSENVVTITPEESAALAARLMTRHNLGVLAVCDYRRRQSGWHGNRCGGCRWWKLGSWWGWCP